MGAQLKQGAAPPQQPPVIPEKTEAASGYVVAPGRSLQIGGKLASPGTPVDIDEADIEWLLDAGFIVSMDDGAQESAGVAVGGLKILGGRKLAGAVR